MKEFCNTIYIYLKNQVEEINNGLVIPKSGEIPISAHAADFDIVPETTDSNASLLTTTLLTLYIDKLLPDAARVLKIKRSVIIQLNRYDNKPSTIGTLQYPAQIIYTPTLNDDILKIEHKQPTYSI